MSFVMRLSVIATALVLGHGSDCSADPLGDPPATPTKATATATAALSLAKAKRERELTAMLATCHADIDAAKAVAEKTHRRLILWVGLKCEDYPTLRADLGDCVHCHVSTYNGDMTARLVVEASDGKQYRVERPDLSIAAVKHAMGDNR